MYEDLKELSNEDRKRSRGVTKQLQSLLDHDVTTVYPHFALDGLRRYEEVARLCKSVGIRHVVMSNYTLHEWVITGWIRDHVATGAAEQLLTDLVKMGALESSLKNTSKVKFDWGFWHCNMDAFGNVERFHLFQKMRDLYPSLDQVFHTDFVERLRVQLLSECDNNMIQDVAIGTRVDSRGYWFNPTHVMDAISNNYYDEQDQKEYNADMYHRSESPHPYFRVLCDGSHDEANQVFFEVHLPVSFYMRKRADILTIPIHLVRIALTLPNNIGYKLRSQTTRMTVTHENVSVRTYTPIAFALFTFPPLSKKSTGIFFVMDYMHRGGDIRQLRTMLYRGKPPDKVLLQYVDFVKLKEGDDTAASKAMLSDILGVMRLVVDALLQPHHERIDFISSINLEDRRF